MGTHSLFEAGISPVIMSPCPGPTFHIDFSFIALYDSVNHGETKTRAFSQSFGGEERIERSN